MSWLSFPRRLAAFFQRAGTEREIEEELRAHIRERADDLVRTQHLERAEAERRARVEFGGFARFKEDSRDEAGAPWLETALRDLRFALRLIRKSPGFALVLVGTLAMGIGANSAIFSVVYAALIRPLPYADPDRLIALTEIRAQTPDAPYWNSSYPDYLDLRRQSRAFSSLAGFSGDSFLLRGSGGSELVAAGQATTNFFSTLGVKPFLGRDFHGGEDTAVGPDVAILTYGFWQSHFGGDRNVLGRALGLDDRSVRIVGVLPRDFEFAPGGGAEFWVPMHISDGRLNRRSLRWMPVIGRLAPGSGFARAEAEMRVLTANLAAADRQANGTIRVVMNPLRDRIVGKVRPLLLVLFAAVGLVLLIACANAANLLLVRATGRAREFAIRTAIGASRARLLSQMFAESFILVLAGGVAGFFIAREGTALLIGAIPDSLLTSLPFLANARGNPLVVAATCGIASLTALLFGFAPALHVSHSRAAETLKEEGRSSATGRRRRLQDILVVAEIAFSVILLVGAGLTVQSLSALLRRDPGFDTRNLLTFSVNLRSPAYEKPEKAARLDRDFTARLARLPGVAAVAENSVIPLTGGGNTIRFVVEGHPSVPGSEDETNIREVSSNYFSTLKIPLFAGRVFNDVDDSPSASQHVIVNRAWVARFLNDRNPIGARIRFTYSATEHWREIIGVVENALDSGLDAGEEASIFLPTAQDPSTFITYLVRANGDPAHLLTPARNAMRELDPDLALITPLTMDQIIAQSPSVFLRRYPSWLIGCFAALALSLAAVGLYGIVSYSVSQRTHEFGIRIAVGAAPSDVMRLVLGESARLTALGTLIGVLCALALTRLMRSLLFGISPSDPPTFIVATLMLGSIALAAASFPARRAVRTGPAVALRRY
ncbi:MAG TPA: ABC transporter permease [Bryobacteraceae bacterium]|nr:ABC transporter permease [Bryobacteraceae bacterium]